MKQVMKLGMIFALSVTATHCSRDEAEQVNNTIHEKKTKSPILSGQSAPTTDLGNIGDYYLDLSTYKLYGPKKEKEWGLPVTLQGATLDKISIGEGAPAQNIGKEGDWYINKTTNALYGPKTDKWEGGIGFPLGNGEYELSTDKTTLMKWTNDRIFTLNMQSDPELKNITKIGNIALAKMRFTSVIIPEKVTSIGKQAFAYTPLESINLPSSITSIGEGAFLFNKLTNITIPSKVTSISKKAFFSNKLTKITIHENVTSIGEQAFFSNQLTKIEIPSNITNIGKEAFHSNDNLRDVTIHAINPPTVDSPFELNNANLKIYVPTNSVETYKAASGWSQYADKIFPIP